MNSTPLTTFRNLSGIFSSVKMAIVDRSRAVSLSAARLLLPLSCATLAIMPSAVEAQIADPYNNAHFLSDAEVTIPVPFSPFGNSLENSKFSDDGSSALTDLSGVILWATADGVTRRLPDTELAVPLYVTNSEVLVWNNRYSSEFESYAQRPQVSLTLYRTNAAGEIFSTPIDLAGKEVLPTPQITTSTGSLTLATSEATDGGTVSFSDGNLTFTAPNSDRLLIRYYRVTFSGVPQLLQTVGDAIPSNAFQTAGPDVEALGFGSDGSAFYRYKSGIVRFDFTQGVIENTFDKFIWVNSLGVSKEVTLTEEVVPSSLPFPEFAGVSKVVSVTDNRLVLEENPADPDNGPLEQLTEFSRDPFNDQLTDANFIPIVGRVLTAPNYTKVGDDKFFYTIEELDGTSKLLNGQRENSYNGDGSNGTFTGGAGYANGDTITLSNGSIVSVIGASPVAPVDAQTHLDYDGFAGNGMFAGGLGYSIGDVITLSDGSVVTVDIVGVPGDVVQFTLDTTGSTGASVGDALTQVGDAAPAGGAGFELTLGDNNVGGGAVTQFIVESSSNDQVVAAGDTLEEVPLGGGFSLTLGDANVATASTINTFKLSGGIANLERSTLTPVFASVNAQISKVNPRDGSAILEDQDQQGLIWLHARGENFVLINDSEDATPLFVTLDECVLWANAKAPIPEGGTPEDALVVHELLDGTGETTSRTELNDPTAGANGEVLGTYVLNTPPYTLSRPFWFFNSAEKTAAEKALIRSYRLLDTLPGTDTDKDGLVDAREDLNGNGVFDSVAAPEDETFYDGVSDNGTFVGGDGAGSLVYVVGDVITLSDGSTVTVDAVNGDGDVTEFTVDYSTSTGADAGDTLNQTGLDGTGTDNTFTLTLDANNLRNYGVKVLINGQDEASYDSTLDNGNFVGGTGHNISDIIILSDGTEIKVDAVGGGGEVTEFTVDASASALSPNDGVTLDQSSTSGAGAGFSLTVQANNVGFETDFENPDTDGDGLSDRAETNTGIFVSTTETGTNPNNPDTDGDGLLDNAETNSGVYVFYNFENDNLASNLANQGDSRNSVGSDPNVPNDTDEDGILDGFDADIDDDGALNQDDAFPFDASENLDTDGDGIGNNEDTDDDNDGVLDENDAFPLDPNFSEYRLSLSSSQQATSSEAQSREVVVTTDLKQKWVWDSDSDWLTSGELTTQTGTQIFTYQVTANNTGAIRTGTIVFQTISGGLSVSLEVTQFGDAALNLTLSTDSQTVPFVANNLEDPTDYYEVGVISNTQWTWETDADWINSNEDLIQRDLLINGQVQSDYDGSDSNGSFVGGDGAGPLEYLVGDRITLSNGSVVTVVAVDDDGDVTEFTIDSLNTSGPLSTVLTQVAIEQFVYTANQDYDGVTKDDTIDQAAYDALPDTVDDVSKENAFDAENISGNDTTFTLTPGAGNIDRNSFYSFKYTVTENKTGIARSANITFVTLDGSVRAVLNVTQLSSTLDTLTVEFNEISVGKNAGSSSLIVDSNTDWGYEISLERYNLVEGQDHTNFDDTGLNGTFSGGDGDGSNAYKVGDQISLSDGSIVTVDLVNGDGDVTEFTLDTTGSKGVAAGDILDQVAIEQFEYTATQDYAGVTSDATIDQAAYDALPDTDDDVSKEDAFDAENISGNDTTFTLTIGEDNINTADSEIWLNSAESDDLNGRRSFRFTFTENQFATPRTGTITFTTASGDVQKTVTVTQESTTLNLSQSAVTVAQEGTDFFDDGISVTSNTIWTWSKDVDWITSSEASPQNGDFFFNDTTFFRYRVQENKTGETRIGTITFKTLAGDIERTLVITQAGTLTLSETQHVNTSSEQSRVFTVFAASDVDWVWSSSATWLTAANELETQTGEQEFTYKVDQNTTGETRVATITFLTTTGGVSASIEVTQLAEDIISLTLSNTAQANSYVEQERTLQVFANTEWIWESSDPSWLTGVGESIRQSGNQEFTYKVAQNNSTESRTAELTFISASGNVVATLAVTQLGGPGRDGLTLSPDSFVIGPDSSVLTSEVLTEKDWQWVSNASWLTSDEEETQSGTQTFTFSADENLGGLARVGTLTFSTTDGALSATVTVTQFASEDDDRDGLSNDEETKPYFLIAGEYTWQQARLDAMRRGGTLAVITDASELADMQSVVGDLEVNVWIGGGNTTAGGNFEWVTGEVFNFTYNSDDPDPWAGEPNNPFGGAGISLQPDFKWDDLNKYTVLDGYILELPKTNPLNPNSFGDSRYLDGDLWVDSDGDGLLGRTELDLGTDPRTADTDRDGLTDGEEFDPFEVIVGAFSWEAAREDAEERAGRLAVIDSEESLVRAMRAVGGSLDNDLWIGGSDLLGAFNFEWITDPVTPVTYANWAENQPNSFFGATAIKLQTDFAWGDANVLELRGYLLEREQTNSKNPDSDGDGLSDGLEVKTYGTDPNNDDTDGDGLSDGNEVQLGSNPLLEDTDGDGLTDGEEDANNNGIIHPDAGETDPANPDTDGDGINDGFEVNGDPKNNGRKSDPNDPNDPNEGAGSDTLPDHYYPELIREQDRSITNGFSPFGNSLEFAKYSDDGSFVVKDDSGVLLWGDSEGILRTVPDSDLSFPLKVTNNELIVWSNRFAPYENYLERPDAVVLLYRIDDDGNISEVPETLDVRGKNVLATPRITTSTGDLVIATSDVILDNQITVDTVITNVELGLTGITFEGYIDNLTIRYYLVTAGGKLQLLDKYSDQIRRDPVLAEPQEVQVESDLEVLGHGSDGSSLLRYTADITRFEGGRRTEVRYLWVNGKGQSRELRLQDGEPLDEISSLVSVTNTRLVAERGAGLGLYDFRRSGTRDQLSGPFVVATQGSVIESEVYTVVGFPKFFYTLEDSTIRTYRLSGASVTLERVSELVNPISNSARVEIINPIDGSAIIAEEDLGFSLWLHDEQDLGGDTGTFTEINSSAFAKPIYVTNGECLLWENALRPIQSNGMPEPVVVVHHELNADLSDPSVVDGSIRRPIPDILGDYVINNTPFTPGFDKWLVYTSKKIDATTVRIKSYLLRGVPSRLGDVDNDGLTGLEESEVETDPFNPDSDGDRLLDGDEIIAGTDPNDPDTDGDGVNDGDELFNGTDPNKESYRISKGDSLTPIKGSFYGLVLRGPDSKPVGWMQVKVTKGDDKRYYLSGMIKGFYQATRKFTGVFDSDGRYNDVVKNAEGIKSSLSMAFSRGLDGRRVIGGTLKAEDGNIQRFNLGKPYYSKTTKLDTPTRGKFTYLMPSVETGSLSTPSGDGVAYGRIYTRGGVKIVGWSSGGQKFTYKKKLQNGNTARKIGTVPVFTRASMLGSPDEFLAGTIRYDGTLMPVDVEGRLRYLKRANNSRYYAGGFDSDIALTGARYRKPGNDNIPADGFKIFANNARGEFGGVLPDSAVFDPYIFTWEADGDLIAPLNFSYFKQGFFRNKQGYYTATYVDGISGKEAQLRGVVLQDTDSVGGQAFVDSSAVTLRHSIVPNDTGEVAPSASIDPVSKKYYNVLGKSIGGTHAVNIEISSNSVVQNWSVSIPAGVDWVAADVTQGTGSGVVNITVSENRSFNDRKAVIQIGGLDHQITQEKRSAD